MSVKKRAGKDERRSGIDALKKRLLAQQPGFDYGQALRELNKNFSYNDLSCLCDCTENGLRKILKGTTPSHPTGEAIYILYVETFNKKPPDRKNTTKVRSG